MFIRDESNTTPTDNPIPLLTSPLKGEEHTMFSLPLKGRVRVGVG